MILTEVIDLDTVGGVRKSGTLGLSPLWDDLRNCRRRFPIYEEGTEKGELFKAAKGLLDNRKRRSPRADGRKRKPNGR